MTRSTSYFLIILGIPIGYILSYFAQPGFFRMFNSLGDYVVKAGSILPPPSDTPNEGLAAMLPAAASTSSVGFSIWVTAWIGIVLGALLMAVVATLLSRKKPAAPPTA